MNQPLPPPPGWYPDPQGTGQMAWWDGEKWVGLPDQTAALYQTTAIPAQTAALPYPEPPRDDFSRRLIVGAVVLVFVLGVSLLAVVVTSTGDTDSKNSAITTSSLVPMPPPTTARTRTPSTPTPTVTPGDMVREWAQGAEPELTALMDSFNSIAAYATSGDIAGTAQACRVLNEAVTNMRDELPAPDPIINRELVAALDDFERSADLCQDFVPGTSPVVIQQAADYMNEGTGHLNTATERMKQLR